MVADIELGVAPGARRPDPPIMWPTEQWAKVIVRGMGSVGPTLEARETIEGRRGLGVPQVFQS